MYDLLLAGIENILHLHYLVPLFLGTLVGLIGGALPGVTITMTIIIVLPFTFGLDPLQGLATMTGVYVGGSAGGAITAALIGIPGTPSAITTTFDGFPMTQKGQPGRAVWLGIWSSFLGGLLAGVFLIGATGPLAAIALEFGPWEYFSLFVFALSMVAVLTEASLIKGLLSGAIGQGNPEGIIASESSCNANVGGSLVTIMAFGIPGDAVTAVMLGAMTIHGIQSGAPVVFQHLGLCFFVFSALSLGAPL